MGLVWLVIHESRITATTSNGNTLTVEAGTGLAKKIHGTQRTSSPITDCNSATAQAVHSRSSDRVN